MKPPIEINTSTIAKLYRTTTSDIEKKLRNLGLSPIKTIQMGSGRRFMVWDKDAAFEALDRYKAKRLAQLEERERLRLELMKKQDTVPRTGYDSPDVRKDEGLPFDAIAKMDEILQELRNLQQEVAELKSRQAA